MKKYYTVTYEVLGSRETDWVMIWAKSIVEAVQEFTELPLISNQYNYTEHAIISIKCK